ncbi:MAG: hypothetical protein ACR2O0_06635, partial [Rhizobiaceae bacterium]
YAHQNIDLRPIPFVENPLPGGEIAANGLQAGNKKEDLAPIIRPKVLSAESQKMLRELERKLRNAKPVNPNQVVAVRSGRQIGESTSN